ncbi:MAG: nucleoside triphosphate pyrophosphohydrolase [Gammaproteobacteria bacterium]
MNDVAWLIDIMARLRHPEHGCPWDIQQTFETIAPYTIEEAYEVADAIERHDLEDLRDELGDLLLQVVYHARMAEESGAFRFDDVVEAICRKMVRRHPHVFGDETVADAGAQTEAWERLKAQERDRRKDEHRDQSHLAGIARGLPALVRAGKLGRRAARAGFDWPDVDGVVAKLHEELAELESDLDDDVRMEDEIGDLLFTVVNLCRHRGLDPERALRRSNAKFERRFRAMETSLASSGTSVSEADGDQLDAAWQEVKRSEC